MLPQKLHYLVLISILSIHTSINIFAECSDASIDVQSGKDLYEQAMSAILLGDISKAEELLKKCLPGLRQEQDYERVSVAYMELGSILFDQGNKEEAFQYTYLAKKTLEENVGTESSIYGICLLNLSVYLYEQNQIAESLIYDKQAIEILEKTKYDKKHIATLLSNLALTLDHIGDYEQAIIYLKKALVYRLSTLGQMNVKTAENYYFLGYVYLNQNKFTEAVKFLKKNLLVILELRDQGASIPDKMFIQSYQRLATCYQKRNEPDSAFYYIHLADELQHTPDSYRRYLSLEIRADIYLIIREIGSAIRNGQEACKSVKVAYRDFQNHPVIARQYTHLGEMYQVDEKLDSAVHCFHQGVIYLANGFEDQNIYSNPKVEQCFPEFNVIRSLRGKAKALYLRYQESKDIKDLQASLETYKLTHDFIKKLKEDITTMGSKQRLAGDALEIYEEAIETALALHEATADKQYLEKALFFAESNKAILLLESMNERMAQSVSGIPDSLLEKEKQFRVDIAYYEREINEENNKKNSDPNLDKVKEWDDKLYTLRREYQQLIDQFEEKYPKYYRLKYDTRLAKVQDIREEMIDRKTAFLEYFVGTQKVYLFAITKGGAKVHQMDKGEDFEENIREIQRMARKPQLSTEEVPDFQERIYLIYRQYLAEAVEHLPTKINRLLIVPDDLLNLIPFELLSRSAEQPDFLIQDYTIGYTYSASLFKAGQRPGTSVADRLFLGYAPAFSAPIAENRSCAGDQLANLENSDREVLGIQALLGGNVMLGTDANRDSFLAQAGHYRIIHLATHACMDEENPMQSKVFFADNPIVNQDLFNLNLSADLAVLSACNTGSGQLVKGDGVLSLSKGFVHAGCPSAVMSLWSVDDFSTSEIMIDFYDYLKKGYTKDEALRKAKLDFIASADKVKKHPFFWAAFVQMGDPIALDLGQVRIPWNLLIVISTLAVIGGYIIRRRSLAA